MKHQKHVNVRKLLPALLVLAWDYMMYAHDVLFRYFIEVTVSEASENSLTPPDWYQNGIAALSCLTFLSFPIFGLLADVWIGRYKAIQFGIAMCFVSWILGGVEIILEYYYEKSIWITFYVAFAAQFVGYLSFKSNIVQYNIDQLIGASAEELSNIIYWHSTAVPIICTFTQLVRCFLNSMPSAFKMYTFMASGLFVSCTLVSHSFFKHKLENVSLIKNPIKLIVRVLCYARKHKYPENRSALTYWEEEAPSRLDLGKRKYGGPFTEEEVEDVKTFFRMLPLFIALVGFACSDNVYNCMYLKSPDHDWTSCFILTDFISFSCSCILLLTYLLLLKGFLYKYIPSMLTRISIGLVFSFSVLFSKAIAFRFYFEEGMRATPPHFNFSLFVPQVLAAIAFTLVIPTSLEFTIAQSPIHIRGVMVGLWLASLGIGYVISIGINMQFTGCTPNSICTDFRAYLIVGTIVLVTLIVFIILAKCYKYRVRENEVNIVQIVDGVYQRYMEQDSRHTMAIDNFSSSSDSGGRSSNTESRSMHTAAAYNT